jgi:ATP-binding cassette subfamily B protein
MMNRPMDSIAHQVEQLQRAGAGIVRIRELLEIENKIKGPQTPLAGVPVSISGALALRFDGVTFGYDDAVPHSGYVPHSGSASPNENNHKNGSESLPDDAADPQRKEIVLHDLNFNLGAGKVLGLLGRTGSGKTTLTRLLFRFYDPDEGVISVSNNGLPGATDIRQLPLGTLRQQVGMVTQNIQLFNASVRDNLTFFDSSVPDAKIERVIDELGLSEWFRALPKGLDTVLESGGGGLSAGEAQLLAFTRIFLADPGLVVLDEASSRLDPATETLIERAVERLVAGRTAIIIAHRLSTIKSVDRILVPHKGEVVEEGSHETLLQQDGLYRQLYEMQAFLLN